MGYLTEGDVNENSGINQLPLGILSYFSNVIGIIGNVLVLYVFLQRYKEQTNYKIFVVCMAAQDLGTCIAHIAKEIGRMISQSSSYISEIICSLGQYMGNSVGMGAVVMALFITFERHRKICTPFKKQITLTQSKLMCGVAFILGGILNIPMYFVTGNRSVVIEKLNTTRCSIKNEYDRHPLPISFLTIQGSLILFSVLFETIFLIKIRKRLEQQSKFKTDKAKPQTSNPLWTIKSKKSIQSTQSEDTFQSSVKSTDSSKITIQSIEMPRELQGKENGKKHIVHLEHPHKKDQTNIQSKKINLENAKNRRIIRTLSVILMLLVISYFSFSMFQLYLCYSRYFVREVWVSRSWDLAIEYVSDVVTINGILNPFVYFFTDKKFHSEIKHICCRR